MEPQGAAFLLFLVVLLSPEAKADTVCATQLSPCSCKTTDGKIVDLNPLSTGEAPRFVSTSGGYIYQWDPCREFDCSTKKVSACQATLSQFIYPIGLQRTAKFNTDPKGLFLQYDDGVGQRSCKVYLKCDPSASSPKYSATGETVTSHYEMTLEAKEVCPSAHGGDAGGSGWSLGDVLLLIFFLAIILYVVIGVVFNIFVRKLSGTNVVPNKDFWISLPGLVSDGGKFAVTKTRGFISKDGAYQQM